MTDRSDHRLRKLTGYRLRRTSIAVMAEFHQIFARFGLRRTTFSSLAVIVDNPGLRQGQIAEALGIERPNMAHIISELEAAGLVRRDVDARDRRAYALRPTEEGAALMAQSMAEVARHDAELTEGLSEHDVAQLFRLLDVVKRNAREMEGRDERGVSQA